MRHCRFFLIPALLWLVAAQIAVATDTTWIFNGDGNWTEAAKWSDGEPASDMFDAVIDDGDTAATVTLNDPRTINSLSIGADDALQIVGLPFGNNRLAQLTVQNDITNNGTIVLTSTNGVDTLSLTSGTLTNGPTGKFDIQFSAFNYPAFTGNLLNQGTVSIEASTSFNKTSGTYTNDGQLTIFSSKTLTINNQGNFIQRDGTLDIEGSLNVTGSTFTYLGGTIVGTPTFSDATLAIGTSHAFNFAITGNTTLALADNSLRAGQSLTIQGFGSIHSATSYTNNGTILAYGTPIGISDAAGALTNGETGLLHFLPSTVTPTFTADLINDGSVVVDSPLQFSNVNGASGANVNRNSFTLSSSMTLTNGASFEQAAGTFTFAGTGAITNGVFRYTGGTIVGTPTLIGSSLFLGKDATGYSNFVLIGDNGLALESGEWALGKTLTLQQSTASSFASIISDAGFVNSGTINIAGGTGFWTRALSIKSGTLENGLTGMIHFYGGGTGFHRLTSDLVNNGSIIVDQTLNLQKVGGSSVNNNQLTLNGGLSLALQGKFQQANGTLTYNTIQPISGGTFEYAGGQIVGTPIFSQSNVIVDATIDGSFSFTFVNTNNTLTLPDNKLASGQTLTLQTGSPFDSSLTVVDGLTSSGVILCKGNNIWTTTIFVSNGGTFTNEEEGLIQFQNASAARYLLKAHVLNRGTMLVDGQTNYQKQNGVFTNEGQLTISKSGIFDLSAGVASTFLQTTGETRVDGLLTSIPSLQFAGGRLTGIGAVHANIDNSGADVEPGNGVGKLTVTGYTQESLGNLTIEIGGSASGKFDVLAVNGSASLAGKLAVQLPDLGSGAFTPAAGNVFQFMTATSGITGQFQQLVLPTLASNLAWKLLYSPNALSLAVTLPEDFNGDGIVNMADYVAWNDTFGNSVPAGTGADANFDGQVTQADLDLWRAHYGETASGSAAVASANVPEPMSGVLVLTAIALMRLKRFRA